MELNINDTIMLILHCGLLVVKLYAVYFILSQMVLIKAPNQKNFMFIFKPLEFILLMFSLIVVISELYFISYYFIDTQSLLYEQIAILDELVFTALMIFYFKKGVKNGN